jgi:hypothetical protein
MLMEIGQSGLSVYVTADKVSPSVSVYLPDFLSNPMPQKELSHCSHWRNDHRKDGRSAAIFSGLSPSQSISILLPQ